MAKILGIGNIVLDVILTIPNFPKEDAEFRCNRRDYQLGGNTTNTLNVLTQLGHQTALVATIANDDAAKTLKKRLDEHAINTQHLQRFIKGDSPTSYIWLCEHNGSRTISHYRNLAEVTFEHFAKIEIEDYDWLHFEARNMENLPGMINIAKTFLRDQPISLEVEKPRDGIEHLFDKVSLIFFSHQYAKAKGYQDAEPFLKAMRKLAPNTQMICTWGNRGAWCVSSKDEWHHEAAQKIDRVVDTLGAGDTFNAAIIHHLIQGEQLQQACHQASLLAARKCQQSGLNQLLKPLATRKPIANAKHITSARATVVPAPGLKHKVVLIKHQDEIKAYENNCPHQDVPLDEAYKIDINPFEMTMKCSVHDAFFRIEDGVCIEGPCWRDELKTVDIEIDEQTGAIFLANK